MPSADLNLLQRQILASGRWFARLPAPLQQHFLANAQVVRLRAGELLFKRGDDNNGLYAVLDGAVRFAAINRAGKESVAALAERPQWFGEVALLDGGPRTHDAWAESEVALAHVPLAAVDRWLAGHPAHWRYLGQLAVHKLRVMFAAVEDASLLGPRDRLIRCLVSLVLAYGQRDTPIEQRLRVSQERLGTMLSLSRQTVNALLQDLEREQVLVCVRGGLGIIDMDRLLELEAAIR
jgi:CRP/FNR family transcriptional regulator, cyclic AMP receptor protein